MFNLGVVFLRFDVNKINEEYVSALNHTVEFT